MHDRECVFDIITHRSELGMDRVRLVMDGDSGTWRLFVSERGNSDFSLAMLREFHQRLATALADIERDPERFNAEVRASWEYE